jgi:hypothetical protein
MTHPAPWLSCRRSDSCRRSKCETASLATAAAPGPANNQRQEKHCTSNIAPSLASTTPAQCVYCTLQECRLHWPAAQSCPSPASKTDALCNHQAGYYPRRAVLDSRWSTGMTQRWLQMIWQFAAALCSRFQTCLCDRVTNSGIWVTKAAC